MPAVNIERNEYSERLKKEFLTETSARKNYTLQFADGTVFTGSNVTSDGISVKESLCSGTNVDFSTVEKSCFETTLINIGQEISDLNGKQFSATIEVNGEVMDYGTWIIQETTREDDDLYSIKAYDMMSKFDVDASDWWNNLKTPITMRNALISLCDFVGVDYCIQEEYTNSALTIDDLGVYVKETTAAEFLGYFQELAGVFYRMPRTYANGTVLVPIRTYMYKGLLPSVTLYPSNDLYPSAESTDHIGNALRNDYNGTLFTGAVDIADYSTAQIDKVQIVGSKDDIGAIAGTGENTYVISNNVLTYGFDAEKLDQTANRILEIYSKITYTPFEAELKGLPYVEPGDTIRIRMPSGKTVVTFVMSREMIGSQDLGDQLSATGTQSRKKETRVNRTIKVLNQKVLELTQTVDENSSKMIDIQNGLQSQITQNANGITLQAISTKAPNLFTDSQFESNFNWIGETRKTNGSIVYHIFDRKIGKHKDGGGMVTFTIHTSELHAYLQSSGWYANQAKFPATYYFYTGWYSAVNADVQPGDYFQFHVKNTLEKKPPMKIKIYNGLFIRYEKTDGTFAGEWVCNSQYYLSNYTEGKEVSSRSGGTFKGTDFKSLDAFEPRALIYIEIESPTQMQGVEDFNVIAREPYITKNVKYTDDQPLLPYGSYNNLSSANVVNQINVSPNGVKIAGEKVDIYGLTTFHGDSDNDGYTKINGPEITAGKISASELKGSTITGGTINGTTLNGSKINSTRSDGTILASIRPTNSGIEIAGNGSFQIACGDLYLSPKNNLWVLKSDGSGATPGLDKDVTFKNWDGDLYRLIFTNGIAWYYEKADWSSNGGYTGTVSGMYYKNGIAMTYNGEEGTH